MLFTRYFLARSPRKRHTNIPYPKLPSPSSHHQTLLCPSPFSPSNNQKPLYKLLQQNHSPHDLSHRITHPLHQFPQPTSSIPFPQARIIDLIPNFLHPSAHPPPRYTKPSISRSITVPSPFSSSPLPYLQTTSPSQNKAPKQPIHLHRTSQYKPINTTTPKNTKSIMYVPSAETPCHFSDLHAVYGNAITSSRQTRNLFPFTISSTAQIEVKIFNRRGC